MVDVTQANDRATALRFLAFCKMEKELDPSLAIFGKSSLPDLVQEWLHHAVERGLMWSTLSNCICANHAHDVATLLSALSALLQMSIR